MLNYTNPKYNGSPFIPVATGDRYYAQDLFRDIRYHQAQRGLILSRLFGSDKIIIEGMEVSQGVGHTIDITLGKSLVPFNVVIPHQTNPWALYPDTETKDIVALIVIEADLLNQSITSANTDGVTTNYVKIKYNEEDGNTRTRAKKSGTYSYEVKPFYTITVDDIAPTSYEVVLETFTSNGSTITFLRGNDDRIEDGIQDINPNIINFPIKSGESLAYGDWVHTDKNGEILIAPSTYETTITKQPSNPNASDTYHDMVILDNDNIACIYTNSSGGVTLVIYDKDGSVIKSETPYTSSVYDIRDTRIFKVGSDRFLVTYLYSPSYTDYYELLDNAGNNISGPAQIDPLIASGASMIKAGGFSNGNYWVLFYGTSNFILKVFNSSGGVVSGPTTVKASHSFNAEFGACTYQGNLCILRHVNSNTLLEAWIYDNTGSIIDSYSYNIEYTVFCPNAYTTTGIPQFGITGMINYRDHLVLAITAYWRNPITGTSNYQYYLETFLARFKFFDYNGDTPPFVALTDLKKINKKISDSVFGLTQNRQFIIKPMQDGKRCFVCSTRTTQGAGPNGIFDMETFQTEEIFPDPPDSSSSTYPTDGGRPTDMGQLSDGSIVQMWSDNSSNIAYVYIRKRNYLLGMVQKINGSDAKINIGKIVVTNRIDLVPRKGYYIDSNGELTDQADGSYKRVGFALNESTIIRDTYPHGGMASNEFITP